MKPTPRIRILAAAAGLALSSRAAFAQERPPEAACATTPWFCWSTSEGADDRPSTGVDALGSGVALTAIGALSFATAPICKTGVVNTAEQSSCFTVSFATGTPLFVLGIPLIVFGAVQHARYGDWARKHPGLSELSFSPTSGGATVGWGATF
jgi:hypothetical protein